ncbi:hypothetical protein LIA77_04854 [Sarocladium implicatum]|nr:hypothetical protein LIA77_04854 [Sarocladium implicatum]
MSSATTSQRTSTDQDAIFSNNMPSTTPSSSGTSSPAPTATNAHQRPQRPAIDPLRQNFPKPTKEVDLDTAMESRPGRWSFRGQLKQQQEREAEQERLGISAHAKTDEQKRAELEATKRELMKSFADMNR